MTNQSLRTIGLLADLPDEVIHGLESDAAWHSFKKGDTIFEQNSKSADLLMVVSGAVSIVNYSSSGREVAYASFASGDYFGEIAAIDGQPRTAHVIALKPSVIATLSPDMFRNLLLTFPEIAMRVMTKLTGIIRSADERILDLSTLSAYERVYRELLALKRDDPVTLGKQLIHPIPTQANIAAKASTTRETVARVLSQLIKDGIIEKKDKTIYIRDMAALEILAQTATIRASCNVTD